MSPKRARSYWPLSWIVASLVAAVFAPPLSADEPVLAVTAVLRTLTPSVDANRQPVPAFRYKWPDEKRWLERTPARVPGPANREPALGLRGWDLAVDKSKAGGLGTPFQSFCAELPIGAEIGAMSRFQILPADTPEAYGQPDTEDGRLEAATRALYVREVFGLRYRKALRDADTARMVQIALWEIVHEAKPAKGETRFDLFAGSFQADYPEVEKAPKFVRDAQGLLGQLTGNGNMLDQHEPDMDLVWLKGLPSPGPGGAVPQSQFALVTRGIPTDSTGGDSAGLSGLISTNTSSNGRSNAGSSNLTGGGQGGGSPNTSGGAGGTPPFSPGNSGGSGGSSPFLPGNTGTTPGPSPLNGPNFLPGDPPIGYPPGREPLKRDPTYEIILTTASVPGPGGAILAGVAVLIFSGRRVIKRSRATPL